jgi:hypothetical protein
MYVSVVGCISTYLYIYVGALHINILPLVIRSFGAGEPILSERTKIFPFFGSIINSMQPITKYFFANN